MCFMENTWVILQSGGLGTRLRPLTDDTSKAIVPFINYFPTTEFVLYGLAKKLGLRNFVFAWLVVWVCTGRGYFVQRIRGMGFGAESVSKVTTQAVVIYLS